MLTENNGYVWLQWYLDEIKRTDPEKWAKLMGKEQRDEEQQDEVSP